jgi:hypothetical protein
MRSKGIEHLLGAPLWERRSPKLTNSWRSYACNSLVSSSEAPLKGGGGGVLGGGDCILSCRH